MKKNPQKRPLTTAVEAALMKQAAGEFREANATELRDRIHLVTSELRSYLGLGECDYIHAESVFPDRIVIRRDSREFAYPYTIGEDNKVTFGEPEEVVKDYVPVGGRMVEAASSEGVFIEADAKSAGRYLVRVIKSGRSGNGVEYPATVLREAAPKFDGTRVFVKGDVEHIRGGGKDFNKLIGQLSDARFVEANGGGEIQATLDVLQSDPVAAKLQEAVERDMSGLFGLSIDARGRFAQRAGFREAQSIDRVTSVDLIIEPGAGGQVLRFIEALHEEDSEVKLKSQMIETIKKQTPAKLDTLDQNDDAAVLGCYREALAVEAAGTAAPETPATPADDVSTAVKTAVDDRMRMVEARQHAATAIAAAQLPQQAKDRLNADFAGQTDFREADVDAAIKREGEYLGSFREAHIEGLGGSIHMEKDRSEKVRDQLDDFFDPSKPTASFREAYIDITGDRQVTGLASNCDMGRMREALGSEIDFREAVSTGTFANALGDSITRAMVREYAQDARWNDWRYLVNVVPLNDFRTQERTRIGGYGNLATVAENAAYPAMTTPGDEKATYAPAKRGGTETLSIESIANDDVGMIQRIPTKMATSAARTLYEFVFSFLSTNPTIYDSVALFHATHNNLGAAALSAAAWSAARVAMQIQTEAGSSKRLGLLASHLTVPIELEEVAYNLFVRTTNNDPNFQQSRAPQIHVSPALTDTDDWFATADLRDTPLIELGFYGGNEQPEIFIQDNPSQGSLFSNDQIKYKIRHIYGGTVEDFRGFYQGKPA